jgi:hypothetical protein
MTEDSAIPWRTEHVPEEAAKDGNECMMLLPRINFTWNKTVNKGRCQNTSQWAPRGGRTDNERPHVFVVFGPYFQGELCNLCAPDIPARIASFAVLEADPWSNEKSQPSV